MSSPSPPVDEILQIPFSLRERTGRGYQATARALSVLKSYDDGASGKATRGGGERYLTQVG